MPFLVQYFKSGLLIFLFSLCNINLEAQETNSTLFEGPTYADVHRTINKNHKFLGSYDFQNGAILFKGVWYKDLSVKYDTYENKLLLKHPRALGAPTIVVNLLGVEAFIIGEHHFISLTPKNREFTKGNYELLASSNGTALYKKHLKKIQRKQQGGLEYFEFKEASSYLMEKPGGFQWMKRLKKETIASLMNTINKNQ